MLLDQSSMDISTLVDKINRGEIDLQPDFQRNQVWSEGKKRRLIDTILRHWYIPAIHIVVNDDLDREEVLDGQQRLRAILEFMDDVYAVDGSIEPIDASILELDGQFFSSLPGNVRSRFRRFTINTIRLRDYRPEEPGELFFRLNQLTELTAAEQRNALVGAPRNQIRELSTEFERSLETSYIGFSNSRMNYDDTLSRLAVTIELDGLSEKITATTLERRYRTGRPFDSDIIDSIKRSIDSLVRVTKAGNFPSKLNKATLFSWMYFIIDYGLFSRENRSLFHKFYFMFEGARGSYYEIDFDGLVAPTNERERMDQINGNRLNDVLRIYNDRSSSRVNDISSVLLRDMCLNVGFALILGDDGLQIETFRRRVGRINFVLKELSGMTESVSDRTYAEAFLAKQWDSRRAQS